MPRLRSVQPRIALPEPRSIYTPLPREISNVSPSSSTPVAPSIAISGSSSRITASVLSGPKPAGG